MTPISERRQLLDFDPTWRVVKWDDCDEFQDGYRGALNQLAANPVSAADVVGVRRRAPAPPIVLIGEFKDFDYPTIPQDQRERVARQAVSEDLIGVLVRKVIDTLAGAPFAHDDNAERSTELRHLTRALGHARPALLVLFCIEVPRTQAPAVLGWTKKLQQRLSWLGPNARVIVTSSHRPFDALGIRYSVPD